MLQLLSTLTYWLITVIQPILQPLCFITAWGLILLLIWSVWSMLRESMTKAQKMHQIPCANCQFFTGSYHLKCSVRPTIAMSEAAIGCSDYQPQPKPYSSSQENL